MLKSRLIGTIILVGSLAACVLSVMQMSRRVAAYNEQAHFGHFRFDVATSRQFRAHDRPITITDADDVPDDGRAALRVTYGDIEKTVPVVQPAVKNVPDLGIYGDWAKIIEVHQVGRDTGSLQDMEGTGRLLLICRIPPAGYNPETWGSVRRADWTFDFHEFKEDGAIDSTTYRWPRSEMGEMGLKKEIEKGDETAKILATIPPLEEQTWQYQAALHVIPKLNVPKYRFKNTAMKAMGWTLPVAGFSGLGAILGIAILMAPHRVKRDDAADSAPL